MADKDDDLLESVTGMADRMGLKGDERRKYVHQHMTRSGYRMEPTYVPADDDDDDDDDGGDGFFSGSTRRRRRGGSDDDDKPRGGQRKRGSGDNWYS